MKKWVVKRTHCVKACVEDEPGESDCACTISTVGDTKKPIKEPLETKNTDPYDRDISIGPEYPNKEWRNRRESEVSLLKVTGSTNSLGGTDVTGPGVGATD